MPSGSFKTIYIDAIEDELIQETKGFEASCKSRLLHITVN
jgi:hypothetical protein